MKQLDHDTLRRARQIKAELDERGKRYRERDPDELGKLRRWLQIGRRAANVPTR